MSKELRSKLRDIGGLEFFMKHNRTLLSLSFLFFEILQIQAQEASPTPVPLELLQYPLKSASVDLILDGGSIGINCVTKADNFLIMLANQREDPPEIKQKIFLIQNENKYEIHSKSEEETQIIYFLQNYLDGIVNDDKNADLKKSLISAIEVIKNRSRFLIRIQSRSLKRKSGTFCLTFHWNAQRASLWRTAWEIL